MPKPSVVLALDQGTTSSRALLFTETGEIVASAQQEFAQIFPQPGWVEHDPEAIWQSQIATAREALDKARLRAGDVAAIGITNQRETTLLWDKQTGEPIANAIVWQDRRTAGECERLKADGHKTFFREHTGLPLDPYFSGTKIAWLLRHVPGAQTRAERGELAFGTVDSWLLWKLTNGRVHATDPTNACRTLLFDLNTGDWSPDLCARLGVPMAVLPQIVPSSGVITHTDPAVFGASIPIAGIAGDQQAALFGQNGTTPGSAKNTYGTGCFLLLHTGSNPVTSTHGLLTTRAATLFGEEPAFALEGSVFTGGAVVQWLRDGLGILATAQDSEALAQTVPDSGGVVLVPAFTGLGTPYWDADARGAILGLTRGTTRAHLARAALEAIAFQSVEVVRAMEKDAGRYLKELRVDGGATANDLLMQTQADLLQSPIVRPRMRETTAWGAARLAGIGIGAWKPEPTTGSEDALFTPKIGSQEAAERMEQWRNAVSRVLSVR